ncbi:MAG: hypothetical protein JO270_05570 [Acidobacteriaceae bacterium]|nr:hypothetical protein [Acidobacteriaceae bacterium]MBV8570558.1 hypothetical protein [Acidobacteriaceae bacterium]
MVWDKTGQDERLRRATSYSGYVSPLLLVQGTKNQTALVGHGVSAIPFDALSLFDMRPPVLYVALAEGGQLRKEETAVAG